MTPREVLIGRRTIHRFVDRPVPPDVVNRALEAAAHAPNHKLSAPWNFFLLGPETASAIIDLNTELLIATKGIAAAEHKRKRWSTMPGWLVVTCRRSEDAIRDREDYAACACAVQNIMLSLWADGLGSKWSTGPVTRDPPMLELLGLDAATHAVVGLIWFGYAAEESSVTRASAQSVTTTLP